MIDSKPHYRILLRGPWECEWLEGPEPEIDDVPRRVRMPISWQDAFGRVGGRVRFTRRFHTPTNLEPDERVLLAFEAAGGQCSFAVNKTSIQPEPYADDVLRCDVTELLQPANVATANVVEVDVEFDAREASEPGGLWELVAVEMHSDTP